MYELGLTVVCCVCARVYFVQRPDRYELGENEAGETRLSRGGPQGASAYRGRET